MNDYETIIKNLNDEFEENSKKIEELENKINILNQNTFEDKISKATAFSLLIWILGTLINFFLTKNITLAPSFSQTLFAGIPIIGGIFAQKISFNKKKSKQKLKEFSNAKSDIELLDEETKYSLEKEKLTVKNEIISQVIDKLTKDNEFIQYASKEYSLTKKEDYTVDEINKNLKIDEELLSNLDLYLNNITMKETLLKKFFYTENKYERILNTGLFATICFTFGLLFFNLPILINNLFSNMTFSIPAITTLGPSILCSIIGIAFNSKVSNYKFKVFEKYNNMLKENMIDEEKYYTLNDLENINIIEKYVDLKYKIEKEKIDIYSLTHKDTIKDNTPNKMTYHNNIAEYNEYNLEEEKGPILKKIKNKF